MSDKKEYIDFCAAKTSLPIFHQPCWWDLVTNNNWDVQKIEIKHLIAYLPYSVDKKWGFTIARNPYLTPYSGLLFTKNYEKPWKELLIFSAEKFLNQFGLSEYDCNPQFCSGLDSLSEIKKSTYLLSLDKPLAQIKSNFKTNLKRNLKKAEQLLKIHEESDSGLFYKIYHDTLQRRAGDKIPEETIHRVANYCIKHQLGKIFTAYDQNNNAHATIWYLEDKTTAYYLLGGTQEVYLGSGAMALLLWHCIQLAHKNGKQTFDFEGSQVPGVARFFGKFGGAKHHYPVLKGKTNPALAVLLKVKNCIR